MPRICLPRVDAVSGTFVGALPPGGREGWHLLMLRLPREAGVPAPGWVATVRFTPAEGGGLPQDVALVRPLRHRLFGAKLAVAFMRGGIRAASVRLYGVPAAPAAISLLLKPLPRTLAVAGIWLQNPRAFRLAGGAVSGRPRERFRKAIAAAATRGQEVPRSYAAWSQLFDTWSDGRVEAVRRALPATPGVAALVFGTPGTGALAATLASLEAQHYRPSRIAVVGADEPGAAVRDAGAADWVAVVQAGEVLPPHALLLLVSEASRNKALEALFADEDRLLPGGRRGDPLFKPQPSLTMMCSGLLSRGVWLIRPALLGGDARWAECLRLQAWFRLHAAGRTQAAWRVPYVLTHRRPDAEAAPPDALAAVVNAHLQSAGVRAVAGGEFPLRLRWHAGDLAGRKVSIIVPSRLKGRTQLSCLTDVLASTRHPNFEMLVVVTQDAPLDEEQEQAAQRLCADPRVRVELLRRPRFNYSAANNFAARRTSGEFLCLLNDDVSTLDGDWLERMVAVFSDHRTGIVGAKLYYPNMTVQHGGAIMGLAGLVEHASRFLPRGEPGYAWRGVLDQELSCVTGACMLVRRSVFEVLCGLDEGLPTAFNDVDFCLRARGLGYSVVFAAGVELIHHETISFGHHYAHDREQEMADVRLMQERWAEVCRADPFHSPNLSLMGKAEWELAYPPRIGVDWGGTGLMPDGGADSGLPGDPALPRLILGSYERLTGASLLPVGVGREEAARWLYEAAPFCVLAHDTAPDPCFVYANKAAQGCFEYSWAEFTALPSRLSAEAPNRAERQRLLDQVSRRGYASGYRGLRVARSGRRFWIEDGTVWQLIGADGAVRGQAATFPRWRDADPGGPAGAAQA